MHIEHPPEQHFQFLPEHGIAAVARTYSQLDHHIQRTETR
jgi:hypothetical protein